MVSSFSNPGFPPVHAHPTRLPALDARLSAAIDSFEASMRAAIRDAIREAMDSALTAIHKAVNPVLADIRNELAQFRRDLALGVEGDSDPASMCSTEAESIEVGHQKLQQLETHDSDSNLPKIPSTIEVNSVPPLLSSSPLLRAMAASSVKPHLNNPMAATVPLQDLAKAMLIAASGQGLGVPLRTARATKSAGLSQLADKETNTRTTKSRHEVLESLIFNLSLGKAKWHWLLLFILVYYLGVVLYDVLLTEIHGWVNWYLVGKFVKKNLFALHLFDEMSKRHNMENMSLSSNLEALDIGVLVCRSLLKDLAASFTEENGTLGHINAIKQFLCLSLLHICALTIMAISQLDYSIFTSLLSKLNQELCNRVDVHHDAVFFPNCIVNDQIFQQPVWCYTLTDPCDNISYQRVVFNQRNTFNQRDYTIWFMEKPCILLSFKVVEENGKRTGFGFVQFDNEDSALPAASALNDTISKGKNLSVSIFVQKSKNDNKLQIFSNTPNPSLSQEVVCYMGLELATNITEACNNRVFGQIVLLLVQVVTTMIRLLEESANLKGLQDGHFRQEEEVFVILSHKHRNDPLKIKEVISMVANSRTSLLNLEIEVKLLLQEDGTTTASILFFRVYGMHFKEQWKYGTKPYVTVLEQHCVSHHVFSYVIGKRWVLVELELHHKKPGIRIQMLTFGSEGGIILRPNLRVDGASVYAWLYDYGRICKVCHKLKVILLDNMAHINVLVAAGVISFGCCWCYFFACSSGMMSTIIVFAYLSLHICLAVSVSWQNELFKFLALDTSQPPYVFKCQLYTLTEVMKDMVEALGLLRSFKSSMHNIGVANDSLKFSDFNDSERIAGFNIQYRLLPSISLFQKMEFYDNQTLGGPCVTGKSYERCFHRGKMYESYTFINKANGKDGFDDRHSRKNILELAPSSFYPHFAKFGRTEKDITPMGGFSHCGVVKDGYIRSNEGCVGPKKRIVNLCQTLLNQTTRLALDDIKLRTISKVIILGNGPIAIVAALVENLLAGSLGVGPFSPFDAAACFLATSMEIEMISWVEIYEEATSNKSSLTKLWGAAITSSGVLSGECPKVESYLQIVFAVPAASLLLQDSLVSARSNKFFNFQP